MRIKVDQLTHKYNGKPGCTAISNLTFQADPGLFIAVIGPSGCGKSTFLRLVAGLLQPSQGSIELDGFSPAQVLPLRQVAWMAQSPALLAWRSVLANVDLAVRFRRAGLPPGITPAQALERVDLADVGNSFPAQLSGGMQQRLALARILVMDARLWLMDEPFAALDELTRENLVQTLLNLWEPQRPTVLWVTHHLHEALRLADRILVLSPSPGRLVADLPVTLERPRHENSPEFLKLLEALRGLLRERPAMEQAT